MVSQSTSVVFEVVDGRAVLVDPSGSELITLNPVGSMIWEALAEPTDADAIARKLLPEFEDVTFDQLHGDVVDFLGELTELGLLAADA
jgi:Coenzyme PQQ synthesis protein D (PqqD)